MALAVEIRYHSLRTRIFKKYFVGFCTLLATLSYPCVQAVTLLVYLLLTREIAEAAHKCTPSCIIKYSSDFWWDIIWMHMQYCCVERKMYGEIIDSYLCYTYWFFSCWVLHFAQIGSDSDFGTYVTFFFFFLNSDSTELSSADNWTMQKKVFKDLITVVVWHSPWSYTTHLQEAHILTHLAVWKGNCHHCPLKTMRLWHSRAETYHGCECMRVKKVQKWGRVRELQPWILCLDNPCSV